MAASEDVVDITYLQDTRLSWAGKGLLTWLHSQPAGTRRVIDAQRFSPSLNELETAADELVRLGYVSAVPLNPFVEQQQQVPSALA